MSVDQVQQIKDKLDIVDVIGGFISVKKAGTTYKAQCPFHQEKTASLNISPQKGVWHCFGCGEGGDMVSFVMKHQHLDFVEAMKVLAAKAGVEWENGNSQTEKLDPLYRAVGFAAAVYHRLLLESQHAEPAREYLKSRGLSDATIRYWGIGYAPEGFQFLVQTFQNKKIDLKLGVRAGVLGQNERGKIYDRFRDRITFPITDARKRQVGFSARVLPGGNSDMGKYINSPDGPIYHKSEVLFGLGQAVEAIRKSEEVIVVEGQMDCIQAHQAGTTNVVATSGTAFTADQARMLSRLARKVILCFDADAAGQKAMRKAVMALLPSGVRVEAVTIPNGKDPDELIREHPGQWQATLKASELAVITIMRQLRQQHAGNELELRQAVRDELWPFLRLLPDSLELDYYLKQASEVLQLPESVLQQSFRQVPVDPNTQKTMPESGVIPEKPSPLLPQQKYVLAGALIMPAFRAWLLTEGATGSDMPESLRPLWEQVLSGMKPDQKFDALVNELRYVLESEQQLAAQNTLALDRQLERSFHSLQLAALKQRQLELASQLKLAEGPQSQVNIAELQQQFVQLSAKRLQLERRLNA